MADAIQNNDSLVTGLEYIRDGQLNNLNLKLFINDYTPTVTSVPADFTEPTFTGYSSIGLMSWGVVTLDAGGYAKTEHGTETFEVTADSDAQFVYGWFLERAGEVWAAARDGNAPIRMSVDGDFYAVSLRQILDQCAAEEEV